MTMNQDLRQMFAGSDEATVKQAEAEMFAKLAAAEGVNLADFTDEQVQQLWDHTFGKHAEDGEEAKKDDEEKDDDEKKEAAAAEHQQKLAFANEVAKAEHLGQVMAESYVQHLNKLGHDLSKEATKALPGPSMRGAFGRALTSVQQAARKGKGAVERGARKAGDFAKEHKGKFIAGGAGAAAGAGGGYVAGKKKESSALSNIDQLALEHAVKLANDAGLDPEVAATRVTSVANLGLDESDKVASTLQEQVHVRALEYLEAAGYPVTWPE
jgi:hypothetical protein